MLLMLMEKQRRVCVEDAGSHTMTSFASREINGGLKCGVIEWSR